MAASQHDVRGGAAAREQWSASRHRWNDAVNTSVHRTWPSLQHHIAIARGRGTGSAPRQQRRRRGRRSTCSETVEGRFFLFTRRPLAVQVSGAKVHHNTSSCSVIVRHHHMVLQSWLVCADALERAPQLSASTQKPICCHYT